MKECYKCGFWNSDYGDCICPLKDKWYACPIENKKPENIKDLENYVEYLSEIEVDPDPEEEE